MGTYKWYVISIPTAREGYIFRGVCFSTWGSAPEGGGLPPEGKGLTSEGGSLPPGRGVCLQGGLPNQPVPKN